MTGIRGAGSWLATTSIRGAEVHARAPLASVAMPDRLARAAPWLILVAGALWSRLIAGPGFVNYDTAYALVWGRDFATGRLPDYGVPVAPTPHPLSNLLGAVLSPLGSGAEAAWVVLGFVFLGALGALVYALGARWFNPAAGLLAAAIVLTREPMLSFGARAYIDIPYLVLVLAALLVETRRRRAGLPVLALLGLAGLLRPEAWLFAAAYGGWLAAGRDRTVRELGGLAAVAALAPVIWLAADWLVTGNPLHSLTGTQENAAVLNRVTGLGAVPITAPRRLGEILREPVLLGAALGGLLSCGLLRARVGLAVVAGVVAMAAFCLLAAAGLPILGRYLLLPAALLAVFCGGALSGWALLGREDPWRRRWQAAAVLTGVALMVFAPGQGRRLERLHGNLQAQGAMQSDLRALMTSSGARRGCDPIGVPNHRLVPLLAFWLDVAPSAVVSAQLARSERGRYVEPATARVERMFTLDKNDPRRLTAGVPPGFGVVARNASWVLHEHCPFP